MMPSWQVVLYISFPLPNSGDLFTHPVFLSLFFLVSSESIFQEAYCSVVFATGRVSLKCLASVDERVEKVANPISISTPFSKFS